MYFNLHEILLQISLITYKYVYNTYLHAESAINRKDEGGSHFSQLWLMKLKSKETKIIFSR